VNEYLYLHGPDGRETDRSDPLDIFKVEQNGSVRWLRAIADLERAKSYVVEILVIAAPADYLILNQRAGERIIIQVTIERDRPSNIPSSAVSSRA
jgi:hypothetical protein